MSNKKLKRCYFTHYKEERPFKICDYSDNTISVFENKYKYKWGTKKLPLKKYYEEIASHHTDQESNVWKFWESFTYQNIWIPEDPRHNEYAGEGLGNSVLIEIEPNKYIFIGYIILAFSLKTSIIDFQSPIIGNDVPYPYAKIKNSYLIFLTVNNPKSKTRILLDEMKISDVDKNALDPYETYYNMNENPPVNDESNYRGKNIVWVEMIHLGLPPVGNRRARRSVGSKKPSRPKRIRGTNYVSKEKRTAKSTKAKRTIRSSKLKKTSRSTKAKKTSRSTRAKKTSRSRR